MVMEMLGESVGSLTESQGDSRVTIGEAGPTHPAHAPASCAGGAHRRAVFSCGRLQVASGMPVGRPATKQVDASASREMPSVEVAQDRAAWQAEESKLLASVLRRQPMAALPLTRWMLDEN